MQLRHAASYANSRLAKDPKGPRIAMCLPRPRLSVVVKRRCKFWELFCTVTPLLIRAHLAESALKAAASRLPVPSNGHRQGQLGSPANARETLLMFLRSTILILSSENDPGMFSSPSSGAVRKWQTCVYELQGLRQSFH